jgi:hypothetical protein
MYMPLKFDLQFWLENLKPTKNAAEAIVWLLLTVWMTLLNRGVAISNIDCDLRLRTTLSTDSACGRMHS